VRRIGHPPLSRTFSKRADAEAWGRQAEAAIERGQLPANDRPALTVTLAELMTRYRDTVSARKRGYEIERLRASPVDDPSMNDDSSTVMMFALLLTAMPTTDPETTTGNVNGALTHCG
jgi:hypothetical protein